MSQYRLTDQIEQALASLASVRELIIDGQEADQILTQLDHVDEVMVELYKSLARGSRPSFNQTNTHNFRPIEMGAD